MTMFQEILNGGPIGNDVYYTGFINGLPVLVRKVGWGATADYWIEFG